MSLLAAAAVLATGCVPARHNLPPEQHLMGPGPGVGGPGPGVIPPMPTAGPGMMGAGGAMMGPSPMASNGATEATQADVQQVGFIRNRIGGGAACGPECGGHGAMGAASGGIPMGMMPQMGMSPGVPSTVQVTFGQPDGMQVRYDVGSGGMFDSEPLVVPARQNFPQGGLYRMKLTNIPTRPGVELYPTVELAYANPRTGAYLAHNSVPLQFTEEDFDQVLTGNFVTKVIYLPDPDFQGPALAGIDTLVSTRLDPGIDPIVEADRRGSILAIIRLGDKDVEMAGTMAPGAAVMSAPIAGLPAPFAPAMTDGCGGPGGSCSPVPPQLPGMVSGMTGPQYGMPRSGTPIGLAGPPHIPLGAPAGLKKHVIRNHTAVKIPRPVSTLKTHVRQQPGMSYPNPVSRIHITEQNINPGIPNGRPAVFGASQRVDPNCNQ